MEFQSILGRYRKEPVEPAKIVMPAFFYDLNLDQIVQDIMDRQKLYDIRRFYYEKASPEDMKYRMEVLKDLESEGVLEGILDFSIGMRKAKEYLAYAKDSVHPLQKQKWKLDGAYSYVECVQKLYTKLEKSKLQSPGLVSFREWLAAYMREDTYTKLRGSSEQLIKEFENMKYHIKINRDRIIVEPGYLEDDYGKKLQDMFHNRKDAEHYYLNSPFGSIGLASLEEAVLKVLKKTYDHSFHKLAEFSDGLTDCIHPMLSEFELESQFYVAFLLYRQEMEEMSFHFCYPMLTEEKFDILDGYDLALAKKNAARGKEVVFNDCDIQKGEQFLVITGPNQGGKTTFARALGQILYFGTLGLMVPAREAAFPRFDNIFTHFATDESMETGAGKLKEELLRLKKLMDTVTGRSFVIINEIFTSATSYDAFIMGKKVINYFLDADCHGVYVTHIYELTKEDARIVSMVASLSEEDENIRTFRIIRRKADGRSYSNTIVEKYHMTYERIKERLTQ